MHGLVNRAIQRFVMDGYGEAQWIAAAHRAGLETPEIEAMLSYDDDVTPGILAAVCDVLDRPYDELMEDIGTYLVSHPNVEALRRLLRFGGVDFVDFLMSLDDLPDRAKLAVSDLHLPTLELYEHTKDYFSLRCHSAIPGYGNLMMGVLRVMADDYGALVYLEHQGRQGNMETVSISLLEAEFAQGRHFDLGARAG